MPADTWHEELLAQTRLKLRCSPRYFLAVVAADKRNSRAFAREGISTYTDAPYLVHSAQEASLDMQRRREPEIIDRGQFAR